MGEKGFLRGMAAEERADCTPPQGGTAEFPAAAKRMDGRRASVKRCLFSDRSPDSHLEIVTEASKSPQRSTLPPPGTEVADSISSCSTSSNVKQFDSENSKEVTKIVTELNLTCCVVADLGQTLDLGKECVSESAIKMPSDSLSNQMSVTINETSETSQDYSRMKQMLLHDECLSKVSGARQQANTRPVEQVPLMPLQQQIQDLPALEVSLLDETKLELKNDEQSQPMKRRRGRKPGSTRAKAIKTIKTPLRASKRLAALRGNQITNSGIVERFQGATTNHSPQLHEKSAKYLDQSGESHLVNRRSFQQNETPIIIDLEQMEELESFNHLGEECTAGKQVQLERCSNDKPLSPFKTPFGDSWPDPCLEFAFKMLTGDISVIEDMTAIQE